MNNQELPTNSNLDSALDIAKQKTRQYAKELWDIVSRHSRNKKFNGDAPLKKPALNRYEFQNKGVLKALSVAPYVLCILFTVSFFWDFNGLKGTLFGYPLHFQGLLRILSVGGLIGYLTNWLAITMLFKPARKRPILGHGLVPAQKDRIAYRLAQAVSEDLINPEIIKLKISESGVISKYRELSTRYVQSILDDPDFREELKGWVVNYVDDMIADSEIRAAIAEKIIREIDNALEGKSIEKVAIRAYSYIRGQEMQDIVEEALGKLPGSVERGLDKLDVLLNTLPAKLDEHSETIENIVTSLLYRLINQLDVHRLVEDNLKSYDEQHISNIIKGATNEQLLYIQYLGAVLGVIGGFVIWEPLLSVLVLGSLTGTILLLDSFLLYQKQRV